jgi:hypothetical protein
MKTLISILITFFLFSFAKAQYLDFSMGIKHVGVDKGSIYFFYVDESPAPDVLSSVVPLRGTRAALSLAVDYEKYQDIQKIYPLGRLSGYFGEVNGVDLGGGVAYPFFLKPDGSLRLHPEMMVIFGFNRKSLGTLSVEAASSVYIQVNSVRYADYASVDASLQSSYFTLRPGCKLAYKINEKMELRVFAGYQIGRGKSKIAFSGETSSGEIVTETENIGARNVYFRVNNTEQYDSPFRVNSFELRVGLAIPF